MAPSWLVGLYWDSEPVCVGAVVAKERLNQTPVVFIGTAAHCVSHTTRAVLFRSDDSLIETPVQHGPDSKARVVKSKGEPLFLTEDLAFLRVEVSENWFAATTALGLAPTGVLPLGLRLWREAKHRAESLAVSTASGGTLKKHLGHLTQQDTRLSRGLGVLCPSGSLVQTNSGAPLVTEDGKFLVGILSTVPVDPDSAGPLPPIAQAENVQGLSWSPACWLSSSYDSGLSWKILFSTEGKCATWKPLKARKMDPPRILKDKG